MDTAKYAHIVGVFRDRAKADQAVEALKQAGMSDVDLTVYDPQAAGVVDSPVDAGGQARGILLLLRAWWRPLRA